MLTVFDRSRRPASLAVGVVAIVILLLAEGSGLRGQTPSTKLTTVLADLAAAVPQDSTSAQVASSTSRAITTSSLPVSVQDAMRAERLRLDTSNAVQVYVLVTAATPNELTQLTAAGATVEITDAPHRRVQARVPASRLELIAALPFVTEVRLPTYAVRHTGAVETEGDAIINADVTRQQFGLDGTGVKVGVISDGLKGVFAASCSTCGGVAGGPIATGDLPAATGTRLLGTLVSSSGGITGQSFQSNHDLEGLPPSSPPCGFSGAGAEGTALLEIVHDVAPAASLSFANADTDMAFNQAVNALAAANDVVVDDLGFFGEPYDGTSTVSANTAAALNNPSNRIRTYVTSVGNEADEHYFGAYVDSGIDGTTISGISNRGHVHLFQQSATTTDVLGLGDQPYNLISLPSGGEVVIFLTWNDPFGGSANNYDLYLVRQSTNAVVARSTDGQTGSQDPSEAIDFTNTGATDFFRIVVQNVRDQAAPRLLNLYSFEPECANDGPRLLAAGHHERHNFNTAMMSVAAESDAGGSPVSVISVGAICSASTTAAGIFAGSTPDESCNDRNHATIEFFSSRGPTTDGRNKPDISAIDGVSVTGAGAFENPFFGTSATGPHVAGEAALLLQAAPCLASAGPGALDPATSRSLLRGLILGGATPLSDQPPDPIFGAGLANALASVRRTLPVFHGLTSLIVPGNSSAGAVITPAALGFTDPDQCGITQLEWTGGCGNSPAGSLSCPIGTTSVSVAASNNGLAFSPPASVAVTVSGFSVAATPGAATVTAGQSASVPITLSAVAGPFTNSVALTCAGLPPDAACAFSPASVVPGAVSGQTTLTITTTARASGTLRIALRGRPWWFVALVCVALAIGARWSWAWEMLGGAEPRGRPSRARLFARRSSAPVLALTLAVVLLYVACGGSPPTGSASARLTPSSLTFASQSIGSASAAQTATLTNTGSTPLAIASIAASGDFSETNTCGSALVASSGCAIAVTFKPTASGSRSGTLSVTDNASTSPQRVSLSGTGASAAAGTPAGTYPIAITATSGGLVQSTTLTLTVQ